MSFICSFCNKEYKREASFLKHSCRQKERFDKRGDKEVRIGFNAYIKFYDLTTKAQKQKTPEDFRISKFYDEFVKFGEYCDSIKAIDVEKYVEFLVKKNKKIHMWYKDSTYNEFIKEYLKTENILDALQRGLRYGIRWSNRNNRDIVQLFNEGKQNEICNAIKDGKISPWILYNCKSGIDFIEGLGSYQRDYIWETIDPSYWNDKFNKHSEDVLYIKSTLNDLGW